MQSQGAHCKQRGRSSGQEAGKPNAEEDQEVKRMRQEGRIQAVENLGCQAKGLNSSGSHADIKQ